jgi:hypothetical protein
MASTRRFVPLLFLMLTSASCSPASPCKNGRACTDGGADAGGRDAGNGGANGGDEDAGSKDAGNEESGQPDAGNDLCTEIRPLDDDGQVQEAPSGLVSCERTGIHRVSSEACAAPNVVACDPRLQGECDTNIDCGDGEECLNVGFDPTLDADECACVRTCTSDAECGDDVCLCASEIPTTRGGISQCVSANCHTDADCAPGVCGASSIFCIAGISSLTCRPPDAECQSDADCPLDSANRQEICIDFGEIGGGWHCASTECD